MSTMRYLWWSQKVPFCKKIKNPPNNPLVQPMDFLKYRPCAVCFWSHFPRYKLPSAPLIELLGSFTSTKCAFLAISSRKKQNKKSSLLASPKEASTTSERYHRSVVQQALRWSSSPEIIESKSLGRFFRAAWVMLFGWGFRMVCGCGHLRSETEIHVWKR